MRFQVPRRLKDLVYPARGELTEIRFREDTWMTALVPDEERFGLVRELVLQRIYDVAGRPARTVVDAGANVGMFSLSAAPHAERVVALEPDPGNYRLLRANVERNRLDNVETIEAAVAAEDGTVSFDCGSHSTGGMIASDGGVEVSALSLDTLEERYGPIDLLKLDIEGAEEAAIPTARLGGIRRIVAELHLTEEGEERPMVDALEAAGFEVEIVPSADLYRPRWVWPVLRRLRALHGQWLIKVGVLAYLLAPIQKPRRPKGGRDMPLLVAHR
jgi:FkbM family methyltransferase